LMDAIAEPLAELQPACPLKTVPFAPALSSRR